MANRVYNWDSLVSAVTNVQEDDSQEYRDYIPTAIALAEDRLAREADSQVLLATTTVSLTNGIRNVNKPSGHRVTHEVLFKTSAGNRRPLRKRDRSYCEVYWPYESSVAEPVYYADADVSAYLIVPTPETDSQIVVTYEKKPDYLSAQNSVNHWTNYYPDALFFGTMSEMATFGRHATMAQKWDARYMEAVQALNNEGRRARRDNLEPHSNPHIVHNTFDGKN